MKKFIIRFLAFALTLTLSVFLMVTVFEDRLVDAFKKQIIDKTSININVSEIHFSIVRNFPYGSFILDDAQIFYSKENRKDTLIAAKKISFKINTLNLFRRIYEFPEIIISNGIINLNNDKLDLLLSEEKTANQTGSDRIETKRIKLNRCRVKYCYKEIVKLSLFLDHSFCSGSLLSDAIELKLNLNIYRLTGSINKFRFKANGLIGVTTTINKRDHIYRSDNGIFIFKSMPFNFSFIYTPKIDLLQISSNTKMISAKEFCGSFLKTLNIGLSQGSLSFESFYSINFNNLNTQKLTVKYEFNNFAFTKYKDFSLSKLKGTTIFSGDFEKNTTEINNFSICHLGLEIEGSLKIKDLSHPYALIDCKFQNIREVNLNNRYTINGNISGKLKSLIKISDINNFDLNTLNIIKIKSEIIFSNLSIKSFEFLKDLEGGIVIDDNSLIFRGKGLIHNSPFTGFFSIENFLDVALRNASPSPVISLDIEHLNLDSIPMSTLTGGDTSASIKYLLNTKIKNLKYKGFMMKDFSIRLEHENGKYQCDQFSLNAFKGSINGNFIYSQQEGYAISSDLQGLDIHNLFNCFNDFGQNTITNKNISGSLSGKFDLSFKQFRNGKIDPFSVVLSSNLEIENGRLIGIGQLKRVYKFLNLNEDDSIHFKTIRNNIDIERGIVKIPSMDVASNALNFTLTGQHGINGEFTYWIKLNLREILAKKYLSHSLHSSEFEVDNKNGLIFFLRINGNNESYKVSFDKKNTVDRIKSDFNQEGLLLKSIIKEEFINSKKDSFWLKKSLAPSPLNKTDSIHNKNQKKPFKIEWDEIDSTKNL